MSRDTNCFPMYFIAVPPIDDLHHRGVEFHMVRYHNIGLAFNPFLTQKTFSISSVQGCILVVCLPPPSPMFPPSRSLGLNLVSWQYLLLSNSLCSPTRNSRKPHRHLTLQTRDPEMHATAAKIR